MRAELVATDEQLAGVAPLLCELRPSFDPASMRRRLREQMAEGYRLAMVSDADDVLCVAGFVIGTKLAWGRHLYVDDLVTRSTARSRGAGAAMLEFLKGHAREQGCAQLHLDSGVSRFDAHRFYLRHGFAIASHHFSITDL